jgi:hypothetical protein
LNFCKNPPKHLKKMFESPITYTTCIKGYNALTAIVVDKNDRSHPLKKTSFIMKQTPDNYIASHQYQLLRKEVSRSTTSPTIHHHLNDPGGPVTQSINDILIRKIIMNASYQEDLVNLSHLCKDIVAPNFYTDGSLSYPTSEECTMGLGWICPDILTDHSNHFNAAVVNHPSSTRAELFALLTALIICPKSSSPTIFLDSQTIIDGYKFFHVN